MKQKGLHWCTLHKKITAYPPYCYLLKVVNLEVLYICFQALKIHFTLYQCFQPVFLVETKTLACVRLWGIYILQCLHKDVTDMCKTYLHHSVDATL